MTSLILENADLNRLFPKCRPKNGATQAAHNNHNNQVTTAGCTVAGGLQQTHAELPTNNRNNHNHHQHNHHYYQRQQPSQKPATNHKHHHHHQHNHQNQNQQVLSILDADEDEVDNCTATADMISNLSNNNNNQASTTLPATIASTTGPQQSHRRSISPHDMIDLDRDPTVDMVSSSRCRTKRSNGRRRSSNSGLSRRQSIQHPPPQQIPNFVDASPVKDNAPFTLMPTPAIGNYAQLMNNKPSTSSSSSSASGRSEDTTPPQYASDQQNDRVSSQQDDSGPEESPIYILTSLKGDRSYKLRDSRIIEIAGGREVYSQSRSKVPARKTRFLSASNSLANNDSPSESKVALKKNNKSPNRPSVWELRSSRCPESRKQRMREEEVTETVFSSEVHSVRRNPNKQLLLDYDNSPKSHSRQPPLIGYANHSEEVINVGSDLGMPKTTHHDDMAVINDGEVVVFDDIDDGRWRNGSKLDQLPQSNVEHHSSHRSPSEPLSSSVCSSPTSPESNYRQQQAQPELITNNKVPRVIGELPIAQYSESPRRYGTREHSRQLPSLLSSPSAIYVPPRPGFPQRVLPTSSNRKEDDVCSEIVVESPVIETQQQQQQQPMEETMIDISTPPIIKLVDNDDDGERRDNEENSNKQQQQNANPSDNLSSLESLGGSTFDYLYEFSETRKVLEEFFKCPPASEKKENSDLFPFQDLDYELRRQGGSAYVGQRLATVPPTTEDVMVHESPKKQKSDHLQMNEHESNFLDLSVGTASSEDLGGPEAGLQVGHSRNFTLSPETTECDSNCGDLDSEMSLMMMDNEIVPSSGLLGSVGDLANNSDSMRIYTSMPVLEDGLSSGHASDTDNNNPTVMLMKRQINEIEKEIVQRTRNDMLGIENDKEFRLPPAASSELLITKRDNNVYNSSELHLDGLDPLGTPPPPAPQGRSQSINLDQPGIEVEAAIKDIRMALQRTKTLPVKSSPVKEPNEPNISPIWIPSLMDGRRRVMTETNSEDSEIRRNTDDMDLEVSEVADEEEADTDLETDRLLGQQRTDDQGFYDDKGWRKPRSRTLLPTKGNSSVTPKRVSNNNSSVGINKPLVVVPTTSIMITTAASTTPASSNGLSALMSTAPSANSNSQLLGVNNNLNNNNNNINATTSLTTSTCTTTATTLALLGAEQPKIGEIQNCSIPSTSINGVGSDLQNSNEVRSPATSPKTPAKSCNDGSPTTPPGSKDQIGKDKDGKKKARNKEVLIEGVLFRAKYLGSTQLVCEGQPTKSTRMCQAEEAVSRIKALAPDGENQPSTEVDLFISTEKIMVLNTDLKEIMMDHALRTISYIADIGDLVVLMARRRFVPHEMEEAPKINRTPKMICHVFESEEAQFIAQAIGRAFQAAYVEFLKANGIEDHSFVKEMDYQEVLNSQEIFGDELQMFAKKEMQKEVVVPKAKGEILGVVIVESGWGSMLPTVVIANLAPSGAAARCGQLNIGDQIIAINGVSLVGLPLSTCQTYIKNSKNQTVVKLTVVPCAPVVEVKIKRPDTKYQLGFSVQNGVICSLLRGGIAERGGVRVGHRIIEINNQSVVAVPHEKIVNLLATSVGEILMKTMPTSMFRLLTGQESPVYI